MRFAILSVAFATFAGLVAAQTIDPNTVPKSTRDTWCSEQTSSCPILCSQTTSSQSTNTQQNSCDADTLSWACVCSDGKTPNSSEFSLAVPFHECQEASNQCVGKCGQNANSCYDNCRTQFPCGAQAPTKANATTSSAASTASSTSTDAGTFGGSKSAASPLLQFGQVYGMCIVAAGLLAGFAILL